jgi:hypothetical protein
MSGNFYLCESAHRSTHSCLCAPSALSRCFASSRLLLLPLLLSLLLLLPLLPLLLPLLLESRPRFDAPS